MFLALKPDAGNRKSSLFGVLAYKLWLPILLAYITPFANFAAENINEPFSGRSLLIYPILLTTATVLPILATWRLLGSKAALYVSFASSVLAFLLFRFALFQYLSGMSNVAPYTTYFAVVAALLAASCALAQYERAWHTWTIALLVMIAIPVGSYLTQAARNTMHARSVETAAAVAPSATKYLRAARRPSVYYITLDAYSRADHLRDVLHFDNSAFLSFLTANHFLVSRGSLSNYMITHLSVSTALQQQYVVTEDDDNFWAEMPRFVDIINGNNSVFRHFQELGYFVAKLNFMNYCPVGSFVDYCDGVSVRNWHYNITIDEADYQLLQLTPFHDVFNHFIVQAFMERAEMKDINSVLKLIKFLSTPKPKFVYAHVFLPHPPYRFDPSCNLENVDLDASRSSDDAKRFVDATQCANRQLTSLINYLNEADPHAIILLNSDHGSGWGVDTRLPYQEWEASVLRNRLANFDAMRLPAECDHMFYDAITPVNYFELVFSCIEGRQPNFQDDRLYISTFGKQYPEKGRVWRYR